MTDVGPCNKNNVVIKASSLYDGPLIKYYYYYYFFDYYTMVLLLITVCEH